MKIWEEEMMFAEERITTIEGIGIAAIIPGSAMSVWNASERRYLEDEVKHLKREKREVLRRC